MAYQDLEGSFDDADVERQPAYQALHHEHTCRDCGMGFDCFGNDAWNGCDRFNGSCGQCELDELTP